MAESIKASVGIRDDGVTQCHNATQDQSVVVGLLNQISQADGGCKEAPLAIKPRWGFCPPELHQAILRFQRKNKGLSVDGHVDPGAATLRKLNEIASRAVPPSSSPTTASTPATTSSRTCALPSGSLFEGWPAELLDTLCRTYKAHGSGNRYLDNSFWGGEPANFEDALTRLGTACQNNGLKWVYNRAAAIKGLWPFILYIHNIWSGDSHGFAFTCSDKGKLRAFLDGSPSFCRDTPIMMSDHQAAGPTQCWREIVDGTAGLHICIPISDTADQSTVAGESGIHIDPHQIVTGKKEGVCEYSVTGIISHGRDVGSGVMKRLLEKKLNDLKKKLSE